MRIIAVPEHYQDYQCNKAADNGKEYISQVLLQLLIDEACHYASLLSYDLHITM